MNQIGGLDVHKLDDILYHHGILGMKWGIRRFQNKDGTRTAEGKKRYSADLNKSLAGMSDDELRRKLNRIRLENAVKDKMVTTTDTKKFGKMGSNVAKIAAATQHMPVTTKLGGSVKNITKLIGEKNMDKARKKIDLSKYSDDQLRRYQLEQEYIQAISPKRKSTIDKVARALEIGASTAGLAASGVYIYNQVKNKKSPISKVFKKRPKKIPKKFRLGPHKSIKEVIW